MPASGNGLSLEVFRPTATSLSVEEFRARHGDAFIVVHAQDISSSPPPSPDTGTDPLRAKTMQPGASPSSTMIVFPVKPSSGAHPAHVTVGRNADSDVHIPHASVSRLHAILKLEGGTWIVEDAKSANGTFVTGIEVPRPGRGSPVAVPPGTKLRFGDVDAVFVSAEGLMGVVRAARR